MAITQLPCIAIQSLNAEEVRWFVDDEACKADYDALIAAHVHQKSTITRFEITVDDELHPDKVTELAHRAMWTVNYCPLQRRHGTDQVFVNDLQTCYQTRQWRHLQNTSNSKEPSYQQYLVEQEAQKQKAFCELMAKYDGKPVGIECRSAERKAWAFVCQNLTANEPQLKWRIQYFDENGLAGHECHKTFIDAVEELVAAYPIQDAGALDREADTEAWSRGLRMQELRDLLNRGLICFADFSSRCAAIANVQTGEFQYEAV